MNCPICGKELKTVTKFNVEVDYCPECKGIWFDKDEIKKISDGVEKFDFPEPNLSQLNVVRTTEKDFPCPRCSERMLKVSSKNSKLIFDYCPNGHGYWFEENEFEQYVRSNLTWK